MEPPPKQGCEGQSMSAVMSSMRLSGTPAEAGVREVGDWAVVCGWTGLSGTPAEAGVRVFLWKILGGVLIILLTLPLFLIHFKKIADRRTAWHVQT